MGNGFCIWGSDPITGYCPSQMENSHQFSFYVDTIMVLLTFAVGHYYHFFYHNHDGPATAKTTTTTKTTTTASFPFTLGIATIIGLHGLLHFGISNGIQCPPGQG